jgi:hypothetical protein
MKRSTQKLFPEREIKIPKEFLKKLDKISLAEFRETEQLAKRYISAHPGKWRKLDAHSPSYNYRKVQQLSLCSPSSGNPSSRLSPRITRAPRGRNPAV